MRLINITIASAFPVFQARLTACACLAAVVCGCNKRPVEPFDILAHLDQIRIVGCESSSRSTASSLRAHLRVEERRIGPDTRTAIAAPACGGLSVDVPSGRGARLRLGYGIDPADWSTPGGVEFVVSLRTKDASMTVHRDSIDPARDPGARRWKEAFVDLSRTNGRRATLLLEATSGSNGAQRRALWARPRVVNRRSSRQRNLIIVSLDTLRLDHLNCYGYATRVTSPEIDRFAREGTLFETALSQAPWTTPSHMSLFTSLYPSFHGVDAPIEADSKRLSSSIPTLAEMLRAQGFVTAAFTGGGPISAVFGFARGFDIYRENYKPRSGSDLRRGFHELSGWLEQHADERFFAFLHTYEIHRPWTHALFSADETDPKACASASYDGDLRYADRFMGRLRQRLDELKLSGSTIVVLLSDHGENLHDRFVDLQPVGHGYHLYDEMLRVPLIFWSPGLIPQGRRIARQARLIDVMPTLIEMLDVKTEAFLQGVSLKTQLLGIHSENAPSAEPSYAIAEATCFGPPRIAVRTESRKYVFTLSLAPDPVRAKEKWRRFYEVPVHELYDLKRDPKETTNIASAHPDAVATLQGIVQRHLTKARAFAAQRADQSVHFDGQLENQLRQLGYLE